jgi:hypothetical protein
MADYVPSSDAGKLTFGQNMVALVTTTPTAWGLTTGIATQLGTYVSDYASALSAATEPATKSRVNTYAKNLARDAMVSYIRQTVVPAIQGSAVVTDEMKYQLGITVRGANPPTPIPAPTDIPVAKIISVNGWTVDVQVTTAETTRRGLPDGVAGINIYTYEGATAPSDPALWTYEGESSRSRFKVALNPELAKGTQVFLTFSYKSPRFQTGPACAGVPVIVGGGVPETVVG